MNNASDLAAYVGIVDQLIERASKDQVAEAARLLAVAVGYYEHRFGEVPQDVLGKMIGAENLDDEGLAMVTAGMENLLSALAEVTGLRDEVTDETRH